MGYSPGPYVGLASLPAPTVITVGASRKVDFVNGLLELDDNGNPKEQRSIPHTVSLRVAVALEGHHPFNTAVGREETRKRVIATLEDMVNVDLDQLLVTFESSTAGVATGLIKFRDLTTDLDERVRF